MRKLTIEEQKNIQLNILLYLDSICKKNNINYSICGGTLLGAIRHKGFIPWDDDIDVFLTRPEYNKLMKILAKEDNYLLITPNTKNYYYVFSRLIDKSTHLKMLLNDEPEIENWGVYIDIFPIDGVSCDKENGIKLIEEMHEKWVNLRMSFKDSYYGDKNKLKSFLKKFIFYPRHLKAKRVGTPEEQKCNLLRLQEKYKFEESTFCAFVLSQYGNREILPKEIYVNTIDVEFEGYMVKGLKYYDEYLRALYGDYMKLPPIEERESHHFYEAYSK